MKFTFNRVKTLIVVSALSVTFIGGWFAESLIGDDYYYEVKRSLRLFGDVYKNVGEKYVDEISPKVIMRTGIDAMLETLDPYTMFYEGSESSDLDAFMKGKYGGIGVTVGIRRNTIMVITVTEGSPAYKAGLKPGDRIVGVDGKTTRDIPIRDLSNSVKGEPGTS
ncbi:MAG TPA: PDZ domain-containing protein, partial [bacterium]|nr:PDZ domain-containing protein [bacterium]